MLNQKDIKKIKHNATVQLQVQLHGIEQVTFFIQIFSGLKFITIHIM